MTIRFEIREANGFPINLGDPGLPAGPAKAKSLSVDFIRRPGVNLLK
jgi:hypothetical protein